MLLLPVKKQKTPACIREIQVHKLWTKVYSQQELTAMHYTHTHTHTGFSRNVKENGTIKVATKLAIGIHQTFSIFVLIN